MDKIKINAWKINESGINGKALLTMFQACSNPHVFNMARAGMWLHVFPIQGCVSKSISKNVTLNDLLGTAHMACLQNLIQAIFGVACKSKPTQKFINLTQLYLACLS